MLDNQTGVIDAYTIGHFDEAFDVIKYQRRPLRRIIDWLSAFMLLVLLIPIAVILLLLNPFLNAGPLWFVQRRMGYKCEPFMAVKFRTMTLSNGSARGPYDALDSHRITALGHFMRETRIDELPQIINVLRGEMSLIGPRPDAFDHACAYMQKVPGYYSRHSVMPGISGLAQVEVGYVDGLEGLHRKVAADLHYIRYATAWMDLWIVWRTLAVVLARRGS